MRMRTGRRAVTAGLLATLCLTSGPARATQEDRGWAYSPPRAVEPPEGAGAGWARNPIDRFIAAGLEEFGLEPAPEADRSTLLRRLSFDLTGLPPTPEEILAFEADQAPGAYERVVDRLLASPAYGERWAQHWLDLARYADTDGFEFDQARPGMWLYRDWVVRALNADLPYDRFLALQMAGDELEPGDPDAAIATGFHRTYADMVDLNDQAERRQNALDDITETTGSVFLGLTIGCAKCHDHKADPIKQTDYYQLQANFTPARFVDDHAVSPTVEALARDRTTLPPNAEPPPPPTARVLAESSAEAPPTFLRIRGEFARKGQEVEPGVPEVLGGDQVGAFMPRPSDRSSGRRSALAAWLTAPNHPLTSRVIVNRLWQHHFGRGIVATPSDFGSMGTQPTHPDLLDWLARELVARGWSLKEMHRLILTSAAYRMATRSDPASADADPANELFWRQNRKRLDGEAIRDAILAASGRLNPEMAGPGVFPELPPELTRLSSHGAIWPVSADARTRDRRSLYVFVRRNLRYPFFEVFDRPDTNASCPNRPVTTIAPQALTLLNDTLAHRAAADLARGLVGAEAERIDLAYLRIFGRFPTAAERAMVRAFLPAGGDWKDLALALLNANEFVYLD